MKGRKRKYDFSDMEVNESKQWKLPPSGIASVSLSSKRYGEKHGMSFRCWTTHKPDGAYVIVMRIS